MGRVDRLCDAQGPYQIMIRSIIKLVFANFDGFVALTSAQMPKSQDLVIFVLVTDNTQNRLLHPLGMCTGNKDYSGRIH